MVFEKTTIQDIIGDNCPRVKMSFVLGQMLGAKVGQGTFCPGDRCPRETDVQGQQLSGAIIVRGNNCPGNFLSRELFVRGNHCPGRTFVWGKHVVLLPTQILLKKTIGLIPFNTTFFKGVGGGV